MRLTGEDVFKKVSALSGGECARLKFAVNMLKKGNVLILDEPTNHLDLSTQEALDRALSEFEGTILMVSHDRYLLNKVPDRIIEITREGFACYLGKFCDYLEKSGNNNKTAETAIKEKANTKENRNYSSKERRQKNAYLKSELAKTEEEIHKEEQEISELESSMRKDEITSDFSQLNDICREIETKQRNLTLLMEKWEKLSLENEIFLSNKETGLL
ncbi:Vitamin B12 import ATP-binding protein BtuD [bioreactor metagenome]|uniref:Vitamin B12 import ATP-binding protein BtuD n=1 Tax=bioreactor metagenome TaxID=1076179 RepID=A0A645EJW3_9ZZZZ